ncbi:piggyBac transposable element-derived protein 4-like [Eupeodes corollae]|uniref:piggyBac transposable element-derived protein 4-like n=1 Tax=Eupeodes corollae TaxID=290404 RepID=UPI00249007F8|nr:piggyBac transposable element-derived protein 4-like [Eupeodes corollae]
MARRAASNQSVSDITFSDDEDDGDFSGSESVFEPPDDDSNTEDDKDTSSESSENDQNVPTFWSNPEPSFEPRLKVSSYRDSIVNDDFNRVDTSLVIFKEIFPQSLFNYIAQCTNERLQIMQKKKRTTKIKLTDEGEIKIVIGCMLIMSYNRVPSSKDYWSKNVSLRNEAIQNAISRDRFVMLISKMYFAPPEKPDGAEKTYYIGDIVECLKHRFLRARQDSPFQSIDESMTKFKGRSSLKQYMPLKPTKRGIKMWLRCDALSGYTYDFNIYSGREEQVLKGTLGERVVNTLAETIKEKDVTLCFDRFFTSIYLLKSLKQAALGTIMTNRKGLPIIHQKLKKGESAIKASNTGVMFVKWHDTKVVSVLSNCHTANVVEVNKKQKNGKQITIPCPEFIKFYREILGGVDRADQLAGLYEVDRKSTKWWKKVFYRLLMMSVVNSNIIHSQLI